ncbi:MAG: hypothetical protein TR69_WS6001000698 [candidate division WS6 bacterium OLB20]|uniref:Uncharacterized protein n=1 Tax=candidate division WS6 bacterium OLB20 TaxID=1617426 RepID=A0A136LYJ7_9BACT|nr:MAG: hypothetical protein TR69_WS6001000698 [candidate division WS6 bacterium OLB20]
MDGETKALLVQQIRYYGESKIFDLNRRDELIAEQSFKLCELIINASSGLLGAIGLSILISESITQTVALILAGNLLFIIFVIYRSFSLRKQILSLRRSVIEKKAHTDSEILTRLTAESYELFQKDYEAFANAIAAIKNEEKEDQKPSAEEINAETTRIIQAIWILRAFFILTLVLTAFAVIIQLGQTVFA